MSTTEQTGVTEPFYNPLEPGYVENPFQDGDRLSSKELRDQVSLLFVAGHETSGR